MLKPLEILKFRICTQRNWLDVALAAKTDDELAALATKKGGVLDGARVDSLIEFGRVVHAEMNALMDAVRRGIAVGGATLYCTTFPCHNCARHLLAAGVKRVVYIEPYPKSLAVKLYKPAIRLDEPHSAGAALSFESFVGISPRRFIPLFELGALKRKGANGFVKEWKRSEVAPRFEQLFADHHRREQLFVIELVRALEQAGIGINSADL